MDNGTHPNTITGVTSWAYHIPMWILVTAGILANLLVIVWRCSRKGAGTHLLSIVIVSLAIADLCFSCHFLLQEVMLAYPVFGSRNPNKTFSLDGMNEKLCLSIAFFAYVSGNVITLMAVAIAIYSVFTFHSCRWATAFIKCFVLLSWIIGFIVGGIITWDFKQHYSFLLKSDFDLEQFSLIVIYGCHGASEHGSALSTYYPIILTTVNAVFSVIVIVLYIYLWRTLGRHFNTDNSGSLEASHFRIRLMIISGLNMLCWWPASVIYWVVMEKNESVYDGSFSPVVSEPSLLIIAAVSVANPIIYTIASKRFFAIARRACKRRLCSRCCNRDRMRLPLLPAGTTEEIDPGCCGMCCRKRVSQQRLFVEIQIPEEATEETEKTGLFTEITE